MLLREAIQVPLRIGTSSKGIQRHDSVLQAEINEKAFIAQSETQNRDIVVRTETMMENNQADSEAVIVNSGLSV